MANAINEEIKADISAMFVNFSRFLEKDVLDSERRFIGKVYDRQEKE